MRIKILYSYKISYLIIVGCVLNVFDEFSLYNNVRHYQSQGNKKIAHHFLKRSVYSRSVNKINGVVTAKSSSDTACKQLSEVGRNKNASKTHLRWQSQKTINQKQKQYFLATNLFFSPLRHLLSKVHVPNINTVFGA